MRIFITGGSGFIGRHLLKLLELGDHNVLCLSHTASILSSGSKLRTILGDLNSPESYLVELKRFRPECCVHLAWEGLPDYSIGNCSKNFLAGIKLFETLGQVGCSKIFSLGTCWEYGKNIGEEIELLSYTQKFLKDEFPIEYEEFNKLTLEYNFPAFSSRINEVKWFKDKVVNEVIIVLLRV